MKQARQIEQLRFGEPGEDLVAVRALVSMALQGEAAHVADHHEYVLVHGVYVEQVELHQPGDSMERGQVARQNAVAVHASGRVGQAVMLAEYREEQRAGADILAETRIDQVPVGT